jgi:hypothetical protein
MGEPFWPSERERVTQLSLPACTSFSRTSTGNYRKYFRRIREFPIAVACTDLLKLASPVKNGATARAGREPCRVVMVGDSCISDQTLATIRGRTKRHPVCGGEPCFNLAPQVIDKLSQSDEGIQ